MRETRERPILFSAPMVRAIIEGRKSQTRRVVKPQPSSVDDAGRWYRMPSGGESLNCYPCPYGVPGDRLWVREMFAAPTKGYGHGAQPQVAYAADQQWKKSPDWKWRPSIHMPRAFSRLTLEVTGVRVERLNDISEADAIAEGSQMPIASAPPSCRRAAFSEREAYARLWDSINGPGSWAANPWVWVIEFRREPAKPAAPEGGE